MCAAIFLTTICGTVLAFLGSAFGQQIFTMASRAATLPGSRAAADASFKELAHDVTDDTAHTGQRSEHIRLQVQSGSFIYYLYNIGKAPLNDKFSASVWVKANRPGVQFKGRLVLPHERNDKHPDELMTVRCGAICTNGGPIPTPGVAQCRQAGPEQQQIQRDELKREVNFTDAYFDCLILNLYCGPGATEVWIDDLDVGPVVDAGSFTATSRPTPGTPRRHCQEHGQASR